MPKRSLTKLSIKSILETSGLNRTNDREAGGRLAFAWKAGEENLVWVCDVTKVKLAEISMNEDISG